MKTTATTTTGDTGNNYLVNSQRPNRKVGPPCLPALQLIASVLT